jgi:hypothetical protein
MLYSRVMLGIHLTFVINFFTRLGAHHALYLNGSNLYPGFELDQLCAPIIAIHRYLSETKDGSFLGDYQAIIATLLKDFHRNGILIYKCTKRISDGANGF